MIGNYSFDNFYTNKNNSQACLATRYVAEHPGESGNLLYIYGFSGSGKTHILYAIEQYINEHNPERNVLLVSSADYINDVIDAIKSGNNEKMKNLREKFRGAEVLLFDDIDFLANKETSMEEFKQSFDVVYETGKQIVINGNASPRKLLKKSLSEKLVF